MQNEQTLLDLGFTRHPEWDFDELGVEHYRKVVNEKIFRAYVEKNNGRIHYVILGEVSTTDGKVKGWRDCCSDGSVARKIFYSTNHLET